MNLSSLTRSVCAALASGLLFTGCTSAVVPAGPDTYYISKGPLSMFQSPARAKADCYAIANKWCTKRGLLMVPISSNTKEPVPGAGGWAELTFRAVATNSVPVK